MSAESLMAKLQKLPQAATDQINTALDSSGQALADDAVTKIDGGARTGRMYGNHQASAPGEYPKSRTGELVASIFKRLESLSVMVGSGLDYGKFLELGTSRMAARPWLRPSYNAILPDARAKITQAVANAIESV